MDRQAMAEKLLKASGLAVIWDEVQFSIREPFLAMADVAIAECAKAAEEGYHEGCRDNAGDFGEPDWLNSSTRAKWGK